MLRKRYVSSAVTMIALSILFASSVKAQERLEQVPKQVAVKQLYLKQSNVQQSTLQQSTLQQSTSQQSTSQQSTLQQSTSQHTQTPLFTEPTPLHISDLLFASDEGQAAMKDFRLRKESGFLARARSQKAELQLGTQQIFKVFNLKTNIRENIDFTLKEVSDRFNIWVETAEFDSAFVRPQDITDLKTALASQTPAGSYNAAAGIIVNDEVVFGDPPDVDGDSKTDVLLVNVRDDFDPAAGNLLYVAGFFDPSDLSSTGNNKDILYLDTRPSIFNTQGNYNPVDGLLGTAAHEYQHLIHANYDNDESTFVNEAQSEWAEVMNGFNGRQMAFLSSLEEHATSFFQFRSDVLTDRERGQLFTLYIAEQHGVLTAGSVTQKGFNNQVGYAEALGSSAVLDQTVNDFFTANLLNDKSIDPRFGYSNPFYTSKRTIVDETVDGRSESNLSPKTLNMTPGSVRYVKLQSVSDVAVNVDVEGTQNVELLRAKIGVRALTKQGGGPYAFVDIAPSESAFEIPGDFDEVILVIVHKSLAIGFQNNVMISYSADWTDGGSNEFVESVAYDDGTQANSFFTTQDAGNSVETTKFVRPVSNGSVVLESVSVTPFFLNEFQGSDIPTTAPRDFKLLVLGDDAGIPDLDQKFFELDVTDPRAFGSSTVNPFTFVNVDLVPYKAQLNNLPDIFHIGFAEAGVDNNYIVHAGSPYSVENISYLGDDRDNSWRRLWDITFTNDGGDMMNTVFPIRASFRVTQIVGVDDELPRSIAFELRQNYPNPFSGSTTIDIQTPAAEDIKLEVFDLLGRKIATVADRLLSAGSHSFAIDASGWASGLYLYRLQAGDVSMTRTMSVLKQ